MFKELRIRNFKAWKDTGEIRMAPITLFFGTNSSGKSSIGQFLMMLRQTVELQDRKVVFYPGTDNTAVQLGSFQEMVFQRDSEKNIGFDYTWSPPSPLQFKDPLKNKAYSADSIEFSAEAGLSKKPIKSTILKQFKYRLFRQESEVMEIGMDLTADAESGYNIFASRYKLVRNLGRKWYPKSVVRFYGFPDEVVAYHQNAAFVQSLNLAHETLFQSIHYLGPLRTKPRRIYSWAGHAPEDVGHAGENAIACILAAADRTISTGHKMRRKPLLELIASKLLEMELIDNFRVKPISRHRQEYEVKVCVKGSQDWVDLPDVGFGISQVLPVLVQCFYAEPGSVIVMEQPEIHLHPKAQALLADVMIDVINSKENGEDRNIQLIIETHSEHFLPRLQRRIAEKTREKAIANEQVSAYFARLDGSKARLEPLEIDLLGNIRNWPVDFFGDTMGDVVARTEAQAERMSQGEMPDE